ncbi:MAG: hypothetical protein ABR520_01655 [Mycobacteriales bacterium]|nr:hypothetical protein [Frankia sp.]
MIGWLVAIVLVAVAAAELAVRRFERRLPLFRFWHDQLTTGKWHQLRRLRRGPRVDVVVAGSSQALMALDPQRLVAPPARCYNAALYRGVPTVMTDWLESVVLPATRPRLVVWGVSILDLNDNGLFHRDVLERYLASPARRRDPVSRAVTWFRVHSSLARRARLLRRPAALARALDRPDDRDGTGKPLDELLGPMGKGLEYVAFDTYRLSPEKEAFIRDKIVNGFSMGGEQLEALRRGIEAVRAFGSDVLLLEMPFTEEFTDMYPRREADVARSRSLLDGVARDLGVRFVTCDGEDLPPGWFADCVHLNGVGMRAWSDDVATVVVGDALGAAR